MTYKKRRDILRLVSIYEEARRGAAGIAIEASPLDSNDPQSIEDFLYSTFAKPSLRSNSPEWFDMMICSSREKIFADNLTAPLDPGDPEHNERDRFRIETEDDAYYPAACLLKEYPTTDGEAQGIPHNLDVPWLDAGGAGDRVTIIITFNHPLITPLGLAPYVAMQARRSAINESFRVTNAQRALGPSGTTAGSINTPTPIPPTDTPVPPSASPLPPSATHTFTPTATDPPEPFSCDNLRVENVTFSNNRFYMEFYNDNIEDTYLMQSEIHWVEEAILNTYPNAEFALKSVDSEVYWQGNDQTSPTSTVGEGAFFGVQLVPGGGVGAQWEGVFVNGPQFLNEVFIPNDFAGSNFLFDHPDPSEADCPILLFLPPIPTPTDIPPGYESPTPTYTPDCASLTLRVEFVSFDPAADVRLRVFNEGGRTAPMTGFNIIWPTVNGIGLKQVVAGGANALDTVSNGGTGVPVWVNPNSGGHTSSPTNSGSVAAWQTDYTFPPFSQTDLHLDFVGYPGTLSSLGISAFDFNGTQFDIWCGTPGTPFGGGGGPTGGGGTTGGGGPGTIFLSTSVPPTPVPTNPPTWTPGPTFTPSRTPSPAPPTNTWTPRPPTMTFTPSPTSQATSTFTPTATQPPRGGGNSDG